MPVYDDFDLDLQEHQDSELSPQLLDKVNKAKNKPLSSFTNIT
jgi:hypothetical protein